MKKNINKYKTDYTCIGSEIYIYSKTS